MGFLRTFFRASFQRRLLAANAAFLLASSLALATVLFLQVRATLHEELEKRGFALTQVLAADARHALEKGEFESLKAQASVLEEEEDLRYVIVQDRDGLIVSQVASPRLDLGHIKSLLVAGAWNPTVPRTLELHDGKGDFILGFNQPVFSEPVPRGSPEAASQSGTQIGTVRVGLSTTRTLGRVTRAFWISLGFGLAVSAAGIVLLRVLTRWTLKPLRRMAQAARSIAQGDLSQRVQVGSVDEIGALAFAFNEMSAGLEQGREELGRRALDLQAAAEEKERLYRNAQDRAMRLEVMNELVKAMASTLEPQEIYEHVQGQLSRLLDYQFLGVQRYRPQGPEFRWDFVWSDRPLASLQVGQAEALEDTPLRALLQSREPVFLPDFNAAPASIDPALVAAGYASGLLVPIVARGQFLGVLVLAARRTHAFPVFEGNTVLAIADTLAVVLNNAELYHRLQASYGELKQAQDLLAQSEESRRAENLRSVGQMASGIAHNFNNVMSAIIGRVQLLKLKALREPLEPAEIQRNLDVIEQAGLDGAETVRRLQEFSRGESHRAERADLNEMVRSVVEITRPRWKDQAERNGIHIRLVSEYGKIPPVAVVPSEIREVLTNLIFNAVDAMPNGGQITIRTFGEGGQACVTVADSGCGMTPEVRDRIFDPFFTTKGVSGTGLGLSTVYGIVKRHQGQMEVTSEPERGATFKIAFPPARPGAARGPEECMMGGRPWRILVGDDEANVREALVEMLRLLGHEVVQAASGQETVEAFGRGAFQLVFTDLGMPDLSGWTVTERIRARDGEVPIVLATGWGAQIEQADAQARGVTRVLAKPFTVQKVTSLIAELQGQARAA